MIGVGLIFQQIYLYICVHKAIIGVQALMAILHGFILFSVLYIAYVVLLRTPLCLADQKIDRHDLHVVEVSSLLPPTTCSTSNSITGESKSPSLNIVHRHGPCSPASLHADQPKTKKLDPLSELFLQDQNKVDSIHYKLSINSRKSELESKKSTKLPATSGTSLGTGNYIVQVGFGTPAKTMSLIFDTGSDLTWMHCKPCVRSCNDQKDPIFNPSESNSYSNISCSTPECALLKSATSINPACGTFNTCVYQIQYGDNSFSVGYFVRETLTVPPCDVFPNFQFGCGQGNQGTFGQSAGLLGLGRNKLSFVSQTTSKYGEVFSYCLPSRSSSIGYLSFGPEASYYGLKFTPLLSDSRGPSFYFLTISTIIVGNRQLPISASVFTTSGVIIDSGTVITRLPPDAYTALKTTFQQYMSKYPKAPALSLLDTCYNFTGNNQILIPKIAFVFQGNVRVDLDASQIMIGISISQICLGFAGNNNASDVAIIGNMQQQNMKIVYDIPNKKLGFGPGNCS